MHQRGGCNSRDHVNIGFHSLLQTYLPFDRKSEEQDMI